MLRFSLKQLKYPVVNGFYTVFLFFNKCMALAKQQKGEIVNVLSDKIKNAKSFVFVKYDGLNVNQSTKVRTECRKEGVECMVAKKTLIQLALKDNSLDSNVDVTKLEGAVMTVLSATDEVQAAKSIKDLSKDLSKLKFLGGFMQKEEGGFYYLDAQAITSLAELPSKLELRAQFVRVINGPVSGFVNVLAGNIRNLANVLNAIKDQKEQA